MWLPHLADAERMAQVLVDHADALRLIGDVTACRVLDARLTHPHRPDSARCTGWAVLEVTTAVDGRTRTARWYVKGYPPGRAAQAWADHRRAQPGTSGRYLADMDLLAWPFPHDPSLTGLADLVRPRSATAYLAAPGDGSPPGDRDADDERDVVVDVVRYQPETSAVVRYRRRRTRPPTTGVYAKLFAPGEADVARVAERHRRLWAMTAREPDPALRVAEPLGVDVGRGVLWTREVLGVPVLATLDVATAEGLADRLAALSATLHASGVADVADGSGAADGGGSGPAGHAAEAVKKVDKLSAAHPAVAERLAALLADGVGRAGDRVTGPDGQASVTVHGDLHVDQLLDSADGLVLVDLDSLTCGPPELDLAELVVDLVLRPVPSEVTTRFVPALLAAYRRRAPAGLDATVLRALADAEFVNRLYRHLRHHAPGWQVRLERELDRHGDVVALLPTR